MKKLIPILIFAIIVLFFFKPFFFQKQLPIPADTIVGLYYPFRDLYAATNPRGVPFHNFLITDPVRQQLPWRNLSISLEKNLQLPLWNPYTFAGVPLLANGQSAVFYPLNLFFFVLPFVTAWSLLIVLQPLLGGLFLFLYLRNLKLHPIASLFGSIAFAFSGFFVAWMEWNTVVQSALWIPLLLLSIDKILFQIQENPKSKIQNAKSQGNVKHEENLIYKQKIIIWSVIFVFSLISSFLAGHLQTFFYVFLVTLVYFIARCVQIRFNRKILVLFLLLTLCFLLATFFQWIPLLQFIILSARNVDQNWHQVGWFIPPQNLLQFVAPDFFGNPATGNYWGVWNYAEFLGYLGIVPLIFSLFALFFRHDKKTLFFGSLFFLSLLFSIQNIIAKIPFNLSIPFLSTAQPTRLLFITDVSLAILAAMGIDYFIKQKTKNIFYPFTFLAFIFAGIWICIFFNSELHIIAPGNIVITKHNMVLPTILFVISVISISSLFFIKQFKYMIFIFCFLFALTVFDVLRVASKFETFSVQSYLFPSTKILSYLQKNAGINRIMTTDDQVLPPNFSMMYRLQMLDGYDPLYLTSYGELIAAMGRMKPDISKPFGFNRIITPHSYSSFLTNLLGVKYVLSLSPITGSQFIPIMNDGLTYLYLNMDALPRVFFVSHVFLEKDKQQAINELFMPDFDPQRNAGVLCPTCSIQTFRNTFTIGRATVLQYQENSITISTAIQQQGFLVLTDTFYPTWHATIDGKETKIYQTDYALRGIVVPQGKHTIIFYDTLF